MGIGSARLLEALRVQGAALPVQPIPGQIQDIPVRFDYRADGETDWLTMPNPFADFYQEGADPEFEDFFQEKQGYKTVGWRYHRTYYETELTSWVRVYDTSLDRINWDDYDNAYTTHRGGLYPISYEQIDHPITIVLFLKRIFNGVLGNSDGIVEFRIRTEESQGWTEVSEWARFAIERGTGRVFGLNEIDNIILPPDPSLPITVLPDYEFPD